MGYKKNLINVITKVYSARIKKYQSLLKPGKYIWNLSLSGLYHKDDESNLEVLNILMQTSDEKNSGFRNIRKILCKIINHFFYIYILSDGSKCSSYNGSFKGSFVLISTVNKDLKFFDIYNKNVITVYGTQKSELILKSLFKLRNYMATTINIETPFWNNDKSCIIEQYIYGKPYELKEFVSKYFYYFKNYLDKDMCDICTVDISKNITNKSDQIIFTFFLNLIDRILRYPQTYLHGDLWKSNIIKEGNVFYLIDYEKAGKYFFLYDFFSLIFYEYLCNNNSFYIDTYFKGGYDELLIDVSRQINFSFQENKKDIYFSLFVYESYYKRWQKENYIPRRCLKEIYDRYYKDWERGGGYAGYSVK